MGELTIQKVSFIIIIGGINMNQLVCVALGNAVRATRKSKNLSQEALAEKLGVCKRTIMDIEKNTGNPKFELLCMLVRELDLPLYEVFYPEVSDNSEMKNVLLKELSDCSDYEMKVILSVVKSLRDSLKKDNDSIINF